MRALRATPAVIKNESFSLHVFVLEQTRNQFKSEYPKWLYPLHVKIRSRASLTTHIYLLLSYPLLLLITTVSLSPFKKGYDQSHVAGAFWVSKNWGTTPLCERPEPYLLLSNPPAV